MRPTPPVIIRAMIIPAAPQQASLPRGRPRSASSHLPIQAALGARPQKIAAGDEGRSVVITRLRPCCCIG